VRTEPLAANPEPDDAHQEERGGVEFAPPSFVLEQVVKWQQDLLAVFAGSYAAFYVRFASQWSYLAGVYNQIKSTECRLQEREEEPEALAEWKSGFIEDAYLLHLINKQGFADTIWEWTKDKDVLEALRASPLGRREDPSANRRGRLCFGRSGWRGGAGRG